MRTCVGESVVRVEEADSADSEAGLRAVARLRALAEQLEADQVAAARRAGWSWQDIAERLGVTKQTVHRKYHHRVQQEGRGSHVQR
ncbi:MAG TPA: helix-turn-helix domain-containing protein [Mycobacteriales bacterium]|nr:helix-turn-helix domain-containing protein [Mycobacteriales bacterium]